MSKPDFQNLAFKTSFSKVDFQHLTLETSLSKHHLASHWQVKNWKLVKISCPNWKWIAKSENWCCWETPGPPETDPERPRSWAEPNVRRRGSDVETETFYAQKWKLVKISCPHCINNYCCWEAPGLPETDPERPRSWAEPSRSRAKAERSWSGADLSRAEPKSGQATQDPSRAEEVANRAKSWFGYKCLQNHLLRG